MEKQKFYDALVEFITVDPMSRTTINADGFYNWIVEQESNRLELLVRQRGFYET